MVRVRVSPKKRSPQVDYAALFFAPMGLRSILNNDFFGEHRACLRRGCRDQICGFLFFAMGNIFGVVSDSHQNVSESLPFGHSVWVML